MHRFLFMVVLVGIVSGCGIARQRELEANIAAVREQAGAARKDCDEKYPPGNPKTTVARAQCANGALTILQPTVPYPDLLSVFMADNIATAEDVEKGRITIAQGNVVMSRKWSDMMAEVQRRNLANRSVMAAEQSASAASSAATARSIALGMQAAGQAMQQRANTPPPAAPASTYCTSQRSGDQVYTNCNQR